jgi:hypothetical protein
MGHRDVLRHDLLGRRLRGPLLAGLRDLGVLETRSSSRGSRPRQPPSPEEGACSSTAS